MASAAVRFHPAAAQEAESTYEWYAARNPGAAHGFREELRQAIDAVAASPRTWPRYGSRARRYLFPRYPFSLVYILRGDGIEVVAVAHGRRCAPPLIRTVEGQEPRRVPMGRTYATENDAERARLKAFVAGLSDATIARSIGHGWTVGIGLAHLAFWDRLWLPKFEEWERTRVVRIPPVENFVNGINDGMLLWWQAIAPAQIRYEVLAAAEAADSKAESLPEALVEAILAVRPRTLIRATHRRQHLDEIERALAN